MAPPANIIKSINDLLTNGMASAAFGTNLHSLIIDILDVRNNYTPQQVLDSASYLSYRISAELMRSSNRNEQAGYARELTETQYPLLYNDPDFPSYFTTRAVQREHALSFLSNLYWIHATLTANAAGETPMPDQDAPLVALQRFVETLFGPWPSVIRVNNNPSGVAETHVALEQDVSALIVIGRDPLGLSGLNVSHHVATWNMQGESGDRENRWTSDVAGMLRGGENVTVVALQECGAPPRSAQQVGSGLVIQDQFGYDHDVEVFRWNLATSDRPNWQQIYFFNVGRIRVNVAVVIREMDTATVSEPVIISDGIPAEGSVANRPAVGIRIRHTDYPDSDIELFTFHAISGGGVNAPRMLREIAHHRARPFAVLGDFNRDPRPTGGGTNPGPWVAPPAIGSIVPANGATHPAGNNMLDYAITNGTYSASDPGTVRTDIRTSDHYPVEFSLHFPVSDQ